MRSHGVTGFPDPVVSRQPGQQQAGIRVSKALASSPQFKTAQQACGSILPALTSAQTPRQQHQATQDKLAFARCMRGDGVTNFPDPTSQGELSLQMVNAAGVDVRSPAVLTAAKTCLPAANGAITAADIQSAESGGG
jgi:hypothetical protein